MQIFDAEATAVLLPYGALADAIRAVLHDQRAGKVHAPPRLAVPLAQNGTLLLMPATDGELAITKLVTVHPHNAAHGLSSVQGDVLVLDAATGKRLYMLEGGAVTARRTAALSLLAAQLLAPDLTGPLLIVGAGTQGRAHLEAFAIGLGIQQIYITSRTSEHAEALAAYARAQGITAQAVASPLDVIDRAPLIVTATTSSQPVLPTQVRLDAFIAAVGAYTPEMAEVPPDLVRRAQIYVDTLEGAQAEAGDLIQAHVDWTHVRPLTAALDQERPRSGPVVFKSVGHALWDLAAARLVVRQQT
jgi:ornithine cyclodeaminase